MTMTTTTRRNVYLQKLNKKVFFVENNLVKRKDGKSAVFSSFQCLLQQTANNNYLFVSFSTGKRKLCLLLFMPQHLPLLSFCTVYSLYPLSKVKYGEYRKIVRKEGTISTLSYRLCSLRPSQKLS